MEKEKKLPSLRSRSITFSIIVGLLVLLIAFFGYLNQTKLSEKTTNEISRREELFGLISQLRINLFGLYSGVNNFLLLPHKTEYKEIINTSFTTAMDVSDALLKKPWIKVSNEAEGIAYWRKSLGSLQQEVDELLEIRTDVSRQYPSLAVGNDVMQPNRNKINSELTVILNEMTTDNTQVDNPHVFSAVLKVKHLWTQMLSVFRLYLANRVGSFNEAALEVQEKSIAILYREVDTQIDKVKMFANKGKLGFESQESIKNIHQYVKNWYGGFEKVVVIHKSGEWRTDVKIMKEKIAPTIEMLTSYLLVLENKINTSVSDDISSYDDMVRQQNRILWAIAILGLVFILIVVFSFDRLIFYPITTVINALKAEASGKQGNIVHEFRSRESQDLIDAFSEMSRQVHIRQKELEYRALHDSLTTLPNRTLLLDRFEHDLYIAKRGGYHLSLLMIDLDRFKEVNDTLGHSVGDSLLIEVGTRIKDVLREVDTVARIGGDEYAILLPSTNEEQALALAQKITIALKDEFLIEGVSLYIAASIGISVYPVHATDIDTLMRYADIAMYVAKRNKLGFEVYNADDDEYSMSRLNLINDLREAIDKAELDIHYQPVIDIKTNTIKRVEALSRWNHPEFGSISPDQFIPLAEQSGLIDSLTYLVINKVTKSLKEWHSQGYELSVAINISVYNFRDDDFIAEVRTALQKNAFSSSFLTLEITEGAMMEHPMQAIDKLSELRNMEVSIAIDDFGTGFSSMAYLKQLPVNELKIDKSFILDIENDESNKAIVLSMIELAHNLGLTVVAEGIENQATWDMLSDFQCDAGQGFFMYKPMPEKELLTVLDKQKV